MVEYTIFALNQWKFSLVVEKKITGQNNWRNKIPKPLLYVLFALAIATQLFFSVYEQSNKNEVICCGVIGVLLLFLIDALVRIRHHLGEYDQNFVTMFSQIIAFVLCFVSLLFAQFKSRTVSINIYWVFQLLSESFLLVAIWRMLSA